MTEPEQETSKPFEFQWKSSTDEKVAHVLQSGLTAVGQLVEGFVKMAGGLGADAVRNGVTATWIHNVAMTLEEAIKACRSGQGVPEGICGTIAYFLDGMADELKGTKFEVQSMNFRKQLLEASSLFEELQKRGQNVEPDSMTQEIFRKLSNIAGYFRGAAGPRPHPGTEETSSARSI